MLFVRDYLTDQKIYKNLDLIKNPTISVILPTYKRFALLKGAIISVLNQTYSNFELIIVDDGSKDGSNELIEEFRRDDSRIIHIRHEANSGLPGLRVNEGIEVARGKYLAFQFDDDVWRPHALQKLVEEAEKHIEPMVVVGRTLITGKHVQIVSPWYELKLANFIETNFIANNSVMFTKSLVENYGMYDPHICMRRLCDWDLWQRLIRYVPFYLVDDIVADVYSEKEDSIGKTAPLDNEIIRYFLSRNRNTLLTPAKWHEYEVDGLSIGNIPLGNKKLQKRIINRQLIPFYKKMNIQYTLNSLSENLNNCKLMLIGLWEYDAIKELAFGHYEEELRKRGDFQTFFEITRFIKDIHKQVSDILLLIRPFQPQAYSAFLDFYSNEIPTAIYYDDDFLNLYEVGEEYLSLAPGTETFSNILDMVNKADAIWLNAATMNSSYGKHNPRLVNIKASIPSSYIEDKLKDKMPPEKNNKPIKIGYVGNAYRIEEFKHIWPALVDISLEYREKIEFEFWGINPEETGFEKLSSKVSIRPFDFNYFHFLDELSRADFDILLSPLLEFSKSRLAKGINKYYFCGVAGALGIFSDVAPYEELLDKTTCLKTKNTISGWYSILKYALSLSPNEFQWLRNNMKTDIYENYTENAQIESFEAAFRATELHGFTRYMRNENGRPNLLFLLQSETISDLDHVEILRIVELIKNFSIEPIIGVCQNKEDKYSTLKKNILTNSKILNSSVFENESIEKWNDFFQENKPFLIHCFGDCRKIINGISNKYPVPVLEKSYQNLYAPEKYFTYGFLKITKMQKDKRNDLVNVGIFIDSEFSKLQNIIDSIDLSKVDKLILFSTSENSCTINHYIKENFKKCKFLSITEYTDSKYDEAIYLLDILLNLTSSEDIPFIIADAMAGGILTISPANEGVKNIIESTNAGLIYDLKKIGSESEILNFSLDLPITQKISILQNGRAIAFQKYHPRVVSNRLLKEYNFLLEETPEGRELISNNRNLIIDEPNPMMTSTTSIGNGKTLAIHCKYDFLSEIEFAIEPQISFGEDKVRIQIASDKKQIIREIFVSVYDGLSVLQVPFISIKNSKNRLLFINVNSQTNLQRFFISSTNELYYKLKYRK